MYMINARERAYDALFEGELAYDPIPEITEVGLAGLWRVHTQKGGRNGSELDQHLETAQADVSTILQEHDSKARQPDPNGDAVFAMIDPKKTLPIIADITSQVVSRWEKANFRNHRPFLLSPVPVTETDQQREGIHNDQARQTESLVVETAYATIRVLPVWTDTPLDPTKRDSKTLANSLANWGPEFLTRWLDGSIVADWLEDQHLTAEQKQDWQEILTPSVLRYYAAHSARDPLSAVIRAKNNLEMLTDEFLAQQLGWTSEEVATIITPTIRKDIAFYKPTDPLEAVRKMSDTYMMLTNEFIAEQLGWTIAEVESIFHESIRKKIASKNFNDPALVLDRIKANLEMLTDEYISERLGWTLEEAELIISPGTRRYIASNIADPVTALDKIKANLELLTDELIAEELGWTVEEAALYFTPGLRMRYATRNIGNPMDAIKKFKINLDLLSDQNIAIHLGWAPDTVAQMFTFPMRLKIAVKHSTNPMSAVTRFVKNIDLMTDEYLAEQLGWTVDKTKEMVFPGMRKQFALNNIADPVSAIKKYFEGNLFYNKGFYINDEE